MPPSNTLLKIGQFAKLAGTNLRTLRYYEELDLLVPASRSEGGFRYYRPTDLSRIRLIQYLQDLGLQLEQIQSLIQGVDPDTTREVWLGKLREILETHRGLLLARIRSLKEQDKQVGDALQHLDSCATCEIVPKQENNFCEPCSATGDALPEILSAIF